MSVPENRCSNSPVVVQSVTQQGILDNETVICDENSESVSHEHRNMVTNEGGLAKSADSLSRSKELGEYFNDIDSTNISDSNTVNVVELNVSQSPIKKNRRKKKINDSNDMTNDRTELQNGLTDSMDPNSEMSFSIQHLNEVFSVWGITRSGKNVKCQKSADTAFSTKFKQVKKDGKEEKDDMNNVGDNKCVSQGKNEDVPCVKQVLECATTSQICPSSGSYNPAIIGKSKSAEKRRKMKKTTEQINNKTTDQENVGNTTLTKTTVPGSLTAEEHASSIVKACAQAKSSNINSKKKLAHEKVSVNLQKTVNELHVLLNTTSVKDMSGTKYLNPSVEMPGGSQSSSELNKTKEHKENDLKSQGNMYHDLAKVDKITKKMLRKQETGQRQNKKKGKTKNKKVVANSSAGSDVLDSSGTPSSSKQNTPQKNQKKKSKTFEEYWSLHTVKECLQNGTLVEGTIRINPKRFTEAYVACPTGGQDILIDGLVDRNRALEGDLVALCLKDPSEWKVKNQRQEKKNSKTDAVPSEIKEDGEELIEESGFLEDAGQKPQVTAKVVIILSQQHSRTSVGYLKLTKKTNDKNALFSPRDARVPRMHIPQSKCPADFWLNPASKANTLYLGKIIKWTSGSFALGEIVKEIGETADVNAETEAILVGNDLDVTPYSDEIRKRFSSLPPAISEEELKKREDLRKECIFTIDPQTAKDLDDAVSCKELENGNLEIGVHISDVTYYLEEDSYLDTEVSKRATSIYLVDEVYHMLPVELCLLCSLLPGEDKLAYSILWEISKEDAKIMSQRIVRSVIHSCAKLAYENAQAMLECPDMKVGDQNDFPDIGNGFSLHDISKAVNNLQMIAKKLRNQRFEGGALRIDQTKLYVQLDSSGKPIAAKEYVIKESHRLIEEFMLLANMTAAKFVYDKYPDIAFLRCHPEPHQFPLEQLQEAMASRGIHLNITSAGALQTSLTRYSDSDYLSQMRFMVLNSLCAKTMTRAKYFCCAGVQEEEFWHYALSVPFYTHFTSPIRRYADIMVHRLLNAALDYCPKPLWGEIHVSEIAANCNKKKHSAKLAGEQSVKLYLSLYLKYNQPAIEDAVVIDVKDYSFDVIVYKYGLTMRVYTSKLDVDIANDPARKSQPMKIIWRSNEKHPEPKLQIVDIFTIVKVKILCEDSLKLEAVLIRPADPEKLVSESEET